MSNTVHVEGIAAQTTEKEVRDFFSFCGKISNLSVTPTSNDAGAPKLASVTFEKETAAKTALLLDNTQLGPSQVQVKAAASLAELADSSKAAGQEPEEAAPQAISQEDKPRSRIVAEYLAHGYVIGDKVIEKAIALDQQHGISSRFTTALKSFDTNYKATERTRSMDEKYSVSQKATAAWNGLNSYFDKALGTPTGQKLRAFYAQGNKQVMDVHNEARHLANLKEGKVPASAVPPSASASAAAPVPGDQSGVAAAGMEKVAGTDKTKCNCGAVSEKCPCAPGTCACEKCAKNTEEQKTG